MTGRFTVAFVKQISGYVHCAFCFPLPLYKTYAERLRKALKKRKSSSPIKLCLLPSLIVFLSSYRDSYIPIKMYTLFLFVDDTNTISSLPLFYCFMQFAQQFCTELQIVEKIFLTVLIILLQFTGLRELKTCYSLFNHQFIKKRFHV